MVCAAPGPLWLLPVRQGVFLINFLFILLQQFNDFNLWSAATYTLFIWNKCACRDVTEEHVHHSWYLATGPDYYILSCFAVKQFTLSFKSNQITDGARYLT